MIMNSKLIIDSSSSSSSSRSRHHRRRDDHQCLFTIIIIGILFIIPSLSAVSAVSAVSVSVSAVSAVSVSAGFTIDEETYLKIPNATLAKSSLRFLTRIPHVAGTEGDKIMAEFVKNEFLNAGIPYVEIDNLIAKLNYPNFDFDFDFDLTTNNNNLMKPTSSLSLWEITNEVDGEVENEDEEEDEEDDNEEEEEEDGTDNPSSSLLLRTTNNNSTSTTIDVEEKKLLRRHNHHKKKKNKLDGKNKKLRNNEKQRKLIYQAKLSEDILDLDVDETTDTIWRNHSFHGYSPSGNLKNVKYVYANYGRPQDFIVLKKLGISIKNKIVIMRYGKCFRGLKVYNTQLHGGIGSIIYSDPMEDGYIKGNVYPNGPWRSSTSIQRGSVQFISHCGGDPYRIDPRYKSLLNTTVKKLCGVNTSQIISSIPSIPLSYKDVIPLLENLGGLAVKEIPLAVENNFEGGLSSIEYNVTYRIGPSKGYLDLMVNNKDAIVEIPNVIGIIPGTLPSDTDQPILLGNHRDAWIYGAADPNSGTAALLEVAKGLGALYKDHNWRPLRTIYLLSWSGEEYGLLGSTGWAELNMEEHTKIGGEESSATSTSTATQQLLQRSLAYLNTDTIVSGDQLKVSSSPTLISLWKSVINDLENEQEQQDNDDTADVDTRSNDVGSIKISSSKNSRFLKNVTIRDANTDWEVVVNENDNTATSGNNNNIGVLGSGSDYTVFLDHFGIPSLDFSYNKKTATYGQYHSIYDSFDWMNKYGGCSGDNDDEDEECNAFELMEFASKIWGLLAMRLATSPVVPIDHVTQGNSLDGYISYLKQELNITTSTSTTTTTTSSRVGSSDHNKTAKNLLDLQNLTDAVENYKKNAAKLQLHCSGVSKKRSVLLSSLSNHQVNNSSNSANTNKNNIITTSNSNDDDDDDYVLLLLLSNEIDVCNEKLGLTERHLLLKDGLPGRPWFKHCLQAPGLDLGYAAEAFPGIQQAIDENNFKIAQEQINLTSERIQLAATNLGLSSGGRMNE